MDQKALYYIFDKHKALKTENSLPSLLAASLQKGKTTTMSVLDMTLNNLMVRFQSLPLLSGQLWPEVVAPDRALSMGQIELNLW